MIQTFTVGDASTVAAIITITDGSTALITRKSDVRIRIPAGLDMAWDTSINVVTIGGAAGGKVKADLKNYEDNGKTAVIDIKQNFAASDQFTVDGLAGIVPAHVDEQVERRVAEEHAVSPAGELGVFALGGGSHGSTL